MARTLRRTLFVVGGTVLAGLLVAAAIGFGGSPAPTAAADGLPPATATVTRGTLTQTQQVAGHLTYGTPAPVTAARADGVLTGVPPLGTVVGLGEPVFTVDEQPVVLLHGTVPMFRTLRAGVAGPDVAQLEQALAALGFTGFTVDDTFTSATAAAVSSWQESLGLPRTGRVEPGDVVVHDGDLRVTAHTAAPGTWLTGPNQEIATVTGTQQVAEVALDVALQHLVHPGDAATVTLPDLTTVEGVVTAVGAVAQGADGATTVPVTVTLTDPDGVAAGFDASPVTLQIVTDTADDVLQVPITALVAVPGGGHAVEVVTGTTTTFVPVTTGLFAQGMVEIAGDGITEGTTVGVAS